MKSTILLNRLLSLLILLPLFTACKHEVDKQPVLCRLTTTNNQLIQTDGQLTDELTRTFAYTDNVLRSVTERSKNGEALFQIAYANNRITQATNDQTVITLSYPASGNLPESATVSQAGTVQAKLTMAYTPTGQLSRLTETRNGPPTNSLTIGRDYTFTYDNSGNLSTERVRFTLTDGIIVEQETEYTFDQQLSPYTHFSELPVLTIIALSQGVETRPGQFWQRSAPVSYKSYNLTSTGSRDNLRESSTFTAVYDADNKLMSQDQNALLYQLSVPDPITKKNRQAFSYQCE